MPDPRLIVGITLFGVAPRILPVHVIRFPDGSDEIHAGEPEDHGDGCWLGQIVPER